MSARFEKIPIVEQERILLAALEEFTNNGYKHASTNTIVVAAGIPKGTLFYYFGSKKNLFFYILDKAVADYVSFVNARQGKLPVDLFDRLLYRHQVKLQFAAANPLLFHFFTKVFLDVPEEIRVDLGNRFSQYSMTSADDLMTGLDRTPFQDDVDIQDAVKMIHIFLDGIFASYAPRIKNVKPDEFNALIQEISAVCKRYFNMIQRGIYR